MGNEQCARWQNYLAIDLLNFRDVEACIREHNPPGPGCTGCPLYPREWEDDYAHEEDE